MLSVMLASIRALGDNGFLRLGDYLFALVNAVSTWLMNH